MERCGYEGEREYRSGYRPTRYFHTYSRPVSGLAGLDVSPSHELENSQWHQEPVSSSLIRPHLLTVAGAAQAYRKSLFRGSLTWFPFNSTAAKRSKHLKRGGHSTRIMRYGMKTSRNEAAVACISTYCLKLHLKDCLIS